MGISTHGLIIAALVTWIVTELFGVNLLVRGRAYLLWQRLRRHLPAALPVPAGLPGRAGRATGRAGAARSQRPPRVPRAPRAMAILVLLHITFAACGLALWLLYVLSDRDELRYVSAGLLVVVVAMGFGIVDRWRHVPGRHASYRPPASQGPGSQGPQASAGPPGPMFPIWSATAHVMAGTATFVLVLLALLADHND